MIGAEVEPEGWAFTDVSYDASSTESVKPISRSLICLNPLKRWKVGFDGDLKSFDLRYTIAHEIGHAIGLDHPLNAGQIMGFRYEELFSDLQAGDIAAAVILYGPHTPEAAIAAAVPAHPIQQRLPTEWHTKRWGSRALPATARRFTPRPMHARHKPRHALGPVTRRHAALREGLRCENASFATAAPLKPRTACDHVDLAGNLKPGQIGRCFPGSIREGSCVRPGLHKR